MQHLSIPLPSILKLAPSEVTGPNADIRKVYFGLVDALFEAYRKTPAGNLPNRFSVTRQSSFSEGTVRRLYTFKFSIEMSGEEVFPEPREMLLSAEILGITSLVKANLTRRHYVQYGV
jgi:hypothetical protein